ncbi:MAG: hypothetical protein JSU94_00095 [Phycisphaerales bacterium]|nr:MAG: hypothetical protein JSU94_00095 [Phycisphaerales bacterium]
MKSILEFNEDNAVECSCLAETAEAGGNVEGERKANRVRQDGDSGGFLGCL